MAKTRLSGAAYVDHGYGQVEPNHLSAKWTGQIYAQLPAAASIDVLENGQFVKYDYRNEEVNFTGAGEWMLVLNEVKLYEDRLGYDDFAMKKEDYVARVYSPINGVGATQAHSRFYGATGADGNPQMPVAHAGQWDPSGTDDPFVVTQFAYPKLMGQGKVMVPRVMKTNNGDLYTTNCVNEATLALGDELTPGADGYLRKVIVSGDDPDPATAMKWQVVKVYTLADRQKAVKLMRIN